jgi:hypothetical protein
MTYILEFINVIEKGQIAHNAKLFCAKVTAKKHSQRVPKFLVDERLE